MRRESTSRISAVAALVALFAIALVAFTGGGALAGPTARPSATPEELAQQLTANDAALRQGIDAWRGSEEHSSVPPPAELIAQARRLQSTVRMLAKRPGLAKRTIGLLSEPLARTVSDLTTAAHKLRLLSRGARPRRLKVGAPEPLAMLVGHYREAQAAHAIAPHYLAAINLVETKFGRVKSKSVSGARGPMQFIPTSWRIYGKGGNINDPHDAILAAARLLRANGAPRSYSRALYHYNPSRLYVAAVQIYATMIARDPHAIHFLYCWGP